MCGGDGTGLSDSGTLWVLDSLPSLTLHLLSTEDYLSNDIGPVSHSVKGGGGGTLVRPWVPSHSGDPSFGRGGEIRDGTKT